MSRPLRILFVAAEMSPLVSTGGLAEVAAALPPALRKRGHDVRVVMPCYQQVPLEHRGEQVALCTAEMGTHTQFGALRLGTVPGSDTPLYLVEHEGYFGRPYPYGTSEHEYEDNAERFCFFCLALLNALPHTGWMPDLVHCHDWHAAAFPVFQRSRYKHDARWSRVPTVFTIHNIAFQGRYESDKLARTGLDPALFENGTVEFHGDLNLMKGALLCADRISTVSERYAQEIQTVEYGEGLDGILRGRTAELCGILNGVDYGVWHPMNDPFLPVNYSSDDLSGKRICKRAIQDRLGLLHMDAPLLGMVSRLYWQKGVDLLVEALKLTAKLDYQVAILGTGDPGIEASLQALAKEFPGRVALDLRYDPTLAHIIQAGSDFMLLPSRYEPCGLGQMYALAYGTVPIVRRTGGLADSVHDAHPVYAKRDESNGLSFVPKTKGALARAIERATLLYADKPAYIALQLRGMGQDFSWETSSARYEALFSDALTAANATGELAHAG